MLALGIETESEETRKDMMKRLEGEKIRIAIRNMADAGVRSFGFFIMGYPGETPAALDRTIDYAIDLNPDFANFYPAVPYPGTELYAKAKRDGLLASEDWSRMEYSFYQLRGNGLDEPIVMNAINRARRRFYLRPSYLARHAGDVVRLAASKWDLVMPVARRVLFGTGSRQSTAGLGGPNSSTRQPGSPAGDPPLHSKNV
jgi:radical SAM superfamily enzyme YgiQ (UPF0313 family)